MQREKLSRRTVLAAATGCAVAGTGVATVGGALDDDGIDAETAEDALSRDSFSIRAGTDQETTVYVTTAPIDGPTAVVVGGIHGNEVAGYEAAREIADWRIDAGTCVTIPEANAIAVEQGTRSGDDWTDLNRQFPEGEPPRTALAEAIWDVIVEYDADVVVDLHESTGIYAGDPVDGVGQAIFHSGGSNAVETARASAEYATENYVDDPGLAFETGPFSGPNTEPSGLLVHKAARDLDADAYLVETLSSGVDLETRIRWHLAITEGLLDDALFEDEPDNGHDPDVDEDAEEKDEASEEAPDDGNGADDANDDSDDGDEDAPIAEIRPEPETGAELTLEPGQTVTLDATCSRPRAGDLVDFEWDVGGTGEFDEAGETFDVTAGDNGRETVTLRVADDAGRTGTASITLSTD
ncbi:succinylglutamate desuccinylase/aspartoacylase family protein [Natrarchaeobius sp. A-rgal3]|uniref:PKD domain-containing protein n=1 Tax=Natrarchaeobius versutus TaxID=1679078 RepID=UPI0035104235